MIKHKESEIDNLEIENLEEEIEKETSILINESQISENYKDLES